VDSFFLTFNKGQTAPKAWKKVGFASVSRATSTVCVVFARLQKKAFYYITLHLLPVNPVQSLPVLIVQIIATQYDHKVYYRSSQKGLAANINSLAGMGPTGVK
jgi:hypothetical protein